MKTRAIERRRWAFVDTSAYFATLDATQRVHPEARRIAARLQRERWRLFTTNFILAETHALLLTRINRVVAQQVLADLDHGPTTIVRVSEADELRAREIIVRYDDKDFSLADATSFAVMERLGIPVAFTFDRNFVQYGLQILTAETP